jgi:hypothetical protein
MKEYLIMGGKHTLLNFALSPQYYHDNKKEDKMGAAGSMD